VAAIIRLATPADAQSVLDIYAPIVRETIISFEYDVPTVEEMADRIAEKVQRYPWLVYERDGQMMGYAYAGTWRARKAYSWVVESTIYVHPAAHRTGIARALYSTLFDLLRLQGYCQVMGGIALPNDASVVFHEALGFTPVGIYRKVGHKQDRWVDVGWWQLELDASTEAPQPPLTIDEARQLPGWAAALSAGAQKLHY
jgi:phosphinothricin acetyltransferase